MNKAIYFDMDGTISLTYDEPGWLRDLIDERTRPYREAKPALDMRALSRVLNALQKKGYHVGIVSWLSRSGTPMYNARVTKTKLDWLARHIGSVNWDEIQIIPYGTPKHESVMYPDGVLFDDEVRNRENWTGTAYDVDNILETLVALL